MSFVVNVNWNADGAEWSVDAWHRDDNWWNAGNRVLSPETPEFLPRSRCGSFCFEAFLPAADHTTKLLYAFGDRRIFFGIERVELPRDAEKKFQHVYFAHCHRKRRQFLGLVLIACDEEKLKYVDKCRIYLVSQGVAG